MSHFRNNLSEKDQLGYLSLCSLSALTLEGNPLSIGLAEEMVSYLSIGVMRLYDSM